MEDVTSFFGIDQMETFIDKQRVKSQRQTMLIDLLLMVTTQCWYCWICRAYIICIYFTCLLYFVLS